MPMHWGGILKGLIYNSSLMFTLFSQSDCILQDSVEVAVANVHSGM